jgi:hypothetical protein
MRRIDWADDVILPVFACMPAILAIGAVLARLWSA